MCGCSHMTTTTMELPSLVCVCVLISCGVSSADANEPAKVVTVMEERDVILPCSLSTKENIESKLFDWRKDGQNDKKEVFLFNAGLHYNNEPSDQQDRQFKGRVFHFQNELKEGNASIIIRKTTCSDSGTYTCIFPRLQPSQTFHIELIVGAAPKPSVTILDQTNDFVLLQCEVLGAFPKPEVEWKDSSGNIVPAKDPLVTKSGGRYDVILQTTVTKTDHYHCVATQEEIHHQIDSQSFVRLSGGAASEPSVKILDQTNDGVLLQCEVLGVSPKPEVEWRDSSGNIVPAEEPKITERGGSYNIILQTTVTKTDRYQCVVTQKEINHQVYAETLVPVNGPRTGWIVAAVLGPLLLLVVLVVGVVLYCIGIIRISPIQSRRRHENGSEMSPGFDHEQGNGLRTEPLLPGSDVPA